MLVTDKQTNKQTNRQTAVQNSKNRLPYASLAHAHRGITMSCVHDRLCTLPHLRFITSCWHVLVCEQHNNKYLQPRGIEVTVSMFPNKVKSLTTAAVRYNLGYTPVQVTLKIRLKPHLIQGTFLCLSCLPAHSPPHLSGPAQPPPRNAGSGRSGNSTPPFHLASVHLSPPLQRYSLQDSPRLVWELFRCPSISWQQGEGEGEGYQQSEEVVEWGGLQDRVGGVSIVRYYDCQFGLTHYSFVGSTSTNTYKLPTNIIECTSENIACVNFLGWEIYTYLMSVGQA